MIWLHRQPGHLLFLIFFLISNLLPALPLSFSSFPLNFSNRYLKKVSKSAANKVSSDESKASCSEAEKKRPVCEDESDNNKAGEPSKKKKKRGMNKARPRAAKLDFRQQLCTSVVKGELCAYGENCRYLHDIEKYVTDHKLPDIGETCVNFEKYGKCIYGITCRYGKKHISQNYENIVNEELYKETASSMTRTVLSKELTFSLRKKQYEFPKADMFLAQLAKVKAEGKEYSELGSLQRPCPKSAGAITDEDVIKLRPQEKKKACTVTIHSIGHML